MSVEKVIADLALRTASPAVWDEIERLRAALRIARAVLAGFDSERMRYPYEQRAIDAIDAALKEKP